MIRTEVNRGYIRTDAPGAHSEDATDRAPPGAGKGNHNMRRSASILFAVAIAATLMTWSGSVFARGGPASAMTRPGAPVSATSANPVAISCPSAGNCAAVGGYASTAGNGYTQPFVVNEKSGKWGSAMALPGFSALKAEAGSLVSISCPSVGNCSSGGIYRTKAGNSEDFVASEKNGAWGKPEEIAGTSSLQSPGSPGLVGVSCGAVGSCSAVGGYGEDGGVFVVNETNGVWGRAKVFPGSGTETVRAISCGAKGYCSFGGQYQLGEHSQAYVETEQKGVWGKFEQVPGSKALNKGGTASLTELSCVSASSCTGAGSYRPETGSYAFAVFVVTETRGKWGTARTLAGLSGSAEKNPTVQSLACASAGNCSLGGEDGAGDVEKAFVANERSGTWGGAAQLAGFSRLNDGYDGVVTLSCGSNGSCAAGGYYTDLNNDEQAFVVDESNSTWGSAEPAPGVAALNVGGGSTHLNALKCASKGNCSAVGTYTSANYYSLPFVMNETNGAWENAEPMSGFAFKG